MKILKGIIVLAICVVIGVGIAHGITYKDNLTNWFNKTFNKTQAPEENENQPETDANISLNSNGLIEIK